MADRSVKVDTSELSDNLEKLLERSEVSVNMYCNEVAKSMENFAKRNRPWTDRTGRARQTLNGFVNITSSLIQVCIAHGVTYGIDLETKHEKRYAILMPTVQHFTSTFLRGLDAIWKRVRL